MKLRLILALFLLAASAPAAGAASLEVDLEVIEPAEESEGQEGEGEGEDRPGEPWFRAVVNGRSALKTSDFFLEPLEAEPPVKIEASEAVTFAESDEEMALVILVQGNYRWMGNETYTDPSDPEAGTVYDGAFKGLGEAIETLAGMGPSGSQGALLVYGGEVTAKQPMGDASELTGAALGSQADYSEYISKPFVAGLTEAERLLSERDHADRRKILVVIGDGFDDNEEISGALRKAIGDLRDAGVEAYTIHYKASAEDGPQGQQNLKKLGYSGHHHATSRSEFATYAGEISDSVGEKRYYVRFPGEEVEFDGKEHEFVVQVGDDASEPILLQLPVFERKADEGGSLWWLWLLLILLIVAVVIAVILIKRKKSRRVPAPVEAPPPQAAAPQKTVMLGVGGSEDAMPIVGWIVPLEGPHQYQTFKLLQGATKLGTGGESHVVVDDAFMSTEHAEIVCQAGGFVLNDLGSTNGTIVNGQRVSTHELVDNDVFRLGKTDFKFKSIN